MGKTQTSNDIMIMGQLLGGRQRGRIFSEQGIVGCLTATDYKDPPKILIKEQINESNNQTWRCLRKS